MKYYKECLDIRDLMMDPEENCAFTIKTFTAKRINDDFDCIVRDVHEKLLSKCNYDFNVKKLKYFLLTNELTKNKVITEDNILEYIYTQRSYIHVKSANKIFKDLTLKNFPNTSKLYQTCSSKTFKNVDTVVIQTTDVLGNVEERTLSVDCLEDLICDQIDELCGRDEYSKYLPSRDFFNDNYVPGNIVKIVELKLIDVNCSKEDKNMINSSFVIFNNIMNNRNLAKIIDVIDHIRGMDVRLINSYSVVYCANCRKNFYNNDILNKEEICSHCGHVHTSKDVKSRLNEPSIYTSNVFNDIEEKGKVSFGFITMSYEYSRKKNSIFPRKTYYKFIYNVEKNKSYLRKQSGNFKQVINISNGHFTPKIFDFDISRPNMDDEVEALFLKNKEELFNILNNYHNFTLGYEDIEETIPSYAKNLFVGSTDKEILNGLINCAILNKNPLAKQDYLEECMPATDLPVVNYARSRYIKDGNYFTKVLGCSPAARSIIFEKPWKVIDYLLFKDVFKDNNNFIKLLRSNLIKKDTIDKFISTNHFKPKVTKTLCEESNAHYIKPTMELLLRLYGNESILANKIVSSKGSYFADTLNYIAFLIDHSLENDFKEVFSKKWNIKELHDCLMRYTRRVKKPNLQIVYSDEEMQLNKTYNKYNFRLAIDTYELLTIGDMMSICVGSYDKRAVRKNCNIVYLAKDDSYLVCIEVVKDKIVQAKCKYNSFPSKEIKELIINWAQDCNLTIATSDINGYDVIQAEREDNRLLENALFEF